MCIKQKASLMRQVPPALRSTLLHIYSSLCFLKNKCDLSFLLPVPFVNLKLNGICMPSFCMASLHCWRIMHAENITLSPCRNSILHKSYYRYIIYMCTSAKSYLRGAFVWHALI